MRRYTQQRHKSMLAGKACFFAFILLGVLIIPYRASAKPPGSFSDLVKVVSPSVVNISSVKVVNPSEQPSSSGPYGQNDPFGDFFYRFFGNNMLRSFKQRGLGSGFIIDAEGYILTNNHVVEQADKIEVTLQDGRSFTATTVGHDPKTDLALIKIKADEDLKPLPLGDSEKSEVGDWVVAVGSPFGLGNTVTAGIISAKYRQIGAGAYDDFIQTDASINPGNSGGPLLNTRGEVIGINTAIFSRSGGNIGIGFAVPVNIAKDLLPQLKKGKIVRGWLGVHIQAVTPSLRDKLDLDTVEGALVSQVIPDSPADKAGLKRGDVIISFDGMAIEEMHDLPYLVSKTDVGRKVAVVIERDGRQKTIEVKIGKLEDEQQPPAENSEADMPKKQLGMALREVTPEMADQYNLAVTSGIVILQVEPGSPASEAGLRPGDIIVEADRKPVKDLTAFLDKVHRTDKGESLLLLINREGSTYFITLGINQ